MSHPEWTRRLRKRPNVAELLLKVQIMAEGHTILLIEDDREISSTIEGVLEAAGYRVFTAPNGIAGRKLVETRTPDLVITDMMMPRMGGFPILEFLKELDSPPKVIMITANEGGRHKAYAEMLGVHDYIRKPFAMDVLLDAISRALEESPPEGPEKRLRRKRSGNKSTDNE